MHKIPVGVLGASGYAGRELCEIIERHPRLALAFATAEERRGEVIPVGGRAVRLIGGEDAPLGEAEVVFSALPHGASAVWVERARSAGARVVDLSSDLRPGNGSTGVPYGLTELLREEVRGSAVVANPGCYPTAVLLALAPLLERGLIPAGATVSIAAASGVTGAGSKPRPDLMFAEVADNFRAYGAGNTHRHLPEMRAMVSRLGGDVDLIFTPHLLPVARGILATITVPLTAPIANPLEIWRDRYRSEPFIEVTDGLPELRHVVHRNVVRITALPLAAMRQPTLLVISAIDNLVKGAAGQAIQNANVQLDLAEVMGLPA